MQLGDVGTMAILVAAVSLVVMVFGMVSWSQVPPHLSKQKQKQKQKSMMSRSLQFFGIHHRALSEVGGLTEIEYRADLVHHLQVLEAPSRQRVGGGQETSGV